MKQNCCMSAVTSGNNHIGKTAKYNREILYSIEKCIHIEEHNGKLNRQASSSLILSKIWSYIQKWQK